MFTKKLSARLLTVAGATALVIGAASGAHAADANLAVTATVSANCTITTAPVAFGVYDPVDVHATDPLEEEGTLTVTCTDDAAATVTLGQGANPDTGSSATAPLRRLYDGSANWLDYELYSEATHTDVWGDDASVDLAYTGTGAAEPLTVYGRIPGGQNVPAASYSDTVLATITF